VSRGEVYEKEWGRLLAGQVDLRPGNTRLTVRALHIPGRQAAELKGIIIRQVAANSAQNKK
jgi:hypothetical protein